MRLASHLSRSLRVSLWLLALGMSLACPEPVVAPGDAGSPTDNVFRPFDAGPRPEIDSGPVAEGDAGPSVPDAGPPGLVGVDSVSPATGGLGGGYRVRVGGFGFTPDSRVFFGDVEADQVLYLSEFSLTCRVPAGGAPGPVRVRVENPLGRGGADDVFTYFSPVTLSDITPRTGTTRGGTSVTLEGESLSADMLVLVGGRQVLDLVVDEGGSTARFLTPPGRPGRHDVVAFDTFGASTLRLVFTYVSDLALDHVAPAAVEAGFAGTVELRGAGFEAATEVRIGGQLAPLDNWIDETRLRVRMPPLLGTGLHDVSVSQGGQTARLRDSLFVMPASTGGFSIDAAVPPRADAAGGTVITLVGQGLLQTASVQVAGTDASDFTLIDDRQLRLVVPPGTPGPASVVIRGTDDRDAALDGLLYLSLPAVEAVEPASGPTLGGTLLTLRGRGFAADVRVRVGGLDATNIEVVGPTEVRAVTPPGSSGPADIVVEVGEERARLPDAFRYESALRALGAFPVRGGMSGGTYVELRGQGFTAPGELGVRFGELEATDVQIVSDNLLTLRTPPGMPGAVDVEVRIGEESSVALRAFTYFDPTFLLGGTRGGPIEGAVYVTVLDAFMGMPVPDLACFLGTDGQGVHVARTNLLGQCTLSSPEIVGPQTVTVAGDGWEYATLVDINASEITLYLQPTTLAGSPGAGTPPPPPPPATIRGRVTGFAKEFFDPAALDPDEIALAVVVTTARDEFSGTPDPGGENVVFQEGGEYFIANARPGRVALVALAGIFNLTTTEFRLRQLGVRRSVYPQLGVNLLDQDIELTIPLDRTVELSMPDAPVRAVGGAPDGPTVTRVVPFLRFGGEGSFAYTDAVNAIRNHDLDTMPDVPGEMVTFIAGAYTTDRAGLITEQGTLNLVAGDAFATGAGTNWDTSDFFGRPLVQGQILVVERPGEVPWATTVVGVQSATRILLDRRPPFSGAGLRYHIGRPTYPSSEVVQDGNGSLLGGVTIQPVLGLPEPLSPEEAGVLEDRTLRWKPAPGQLPTTHMHYVFQYDDWFGGGELAVLWTFYIDGARTKVPIPRLPAALDTLDLEVLPGDLLPGGVAWQHMSIYSPGFDYENFSYLEIGSRGRRAWTTDVHFFVNPGP